MNEQYNSELLALTKADQDMQKENVQGLVTKKITPDEYIEQQAIIGRLFKAGMTEIEARTKGIITPTD